MAAAAAADVRNVQEFDGENEDSDVGAQQDSEFVAGIERDIFR